MKNYKLVQQIKRLKDLLCEDPEKALDRLKELPDINNVKEVDDEDRYEITMILGDANYYNYRFKHAINYFEKALKNSACKDKFTCYYRLGDCYFEIDGYKTSVDFYKRALSKDNIDKKILGQIYHGLVMDYINMHNFRSAISYANKMIRLYKNFKTELQQELYQSAFSLIATCYWKMGDNKKSEEYFQKTIALPNISSWILAHTYANKAHRLFENKKWEEAIENYKQAISITDSEENKKNWQRYVKLCEKELKSKGK